MKHTNELRYKEWSPKAKMIVMMLFSLSLVFVGILSEPSLNGAWNNLWRVLEHSNVFLADYLYIGENALLVRKAILERLAFLGIEIDDEANDTRGQEILISTQNSKIKAFVIPMNEEIMIARDTLSFL